MAKWLKKIHAKVNFESSFEERVVITMQKEVTGIFSVFYKEHAKP